MVTLEQREQLLQQLNRAAAGLDTMVQAGISGKAGIEKLLYGKFVDDEETRRQLLLGQSFMYSAFRDIGQVLGIVNERQSPRYDPMLVVRHFSRTSGKGREALRSIAGMTHEAKKLFVHLLRPSVVSVDDLVFSSNVTEVLVSAYQREMNLVPKRAAMIRSNAFPEKAFDAKFPYSSNDRNT